MVRRRRGLDGLALNPICQHPGPQSTIGAKCHTRVVVVVSYQTLKTGKKRQLARTTVVRFRRRLLFGRFGYLIVCVFYISDIPII